MAVSDDTATSPSSHNLSAPFESFDALSSLLLLLPDLLDLLDLLPDDDVLDPELRVCKEGTGNQRRRRAALE